MADFLYKIHESIPFEEVDIGTCISDFVRSKATGSRIYSEFVGRQTIWLTELLTS